NWTFDAPIFGIPFGAKHISVHVELSDDYDVVPDGYRQFLRYAQGEQPNVSANDFAELVRENRPQWLINIIHSIAPHNTSNADIRNELQRLLNQLRVRRVSPRVAPSGNVQIDAGAGAAGGAPPPRRAERGGGGARAPAPRPAGGAARAERAGEVRNTGGAAA